MKSDIHNKDFARRLALKERLRGLGNDRLSVSGCRKSAVSKPRKD